MLTLLTVCGAISDVYDDYDYYEDEVAQSSVRVEQAVPNSLPGPVPPPAAALHRLLRGLSVRLAVRATTGVRTPPPPPNHHQSAPA